MLVPTNLVSVIAYTIARRFGNAIRTFFFSTDRFNLPFCIEPSRLIRCRVVQTSFFSLALVGLEAWPGYEQGPIGSFLYQRAKPPQGIVLFINLLGKGWTPRAFKGDGGSI